MCCRLACRHSNPPQVEPEFHVVVRDLVRSVARMQPGNRESVQRELGSSPRHSQTICFVDTQQRVKSTVEMGTSL